MNYDYLTKIRSQVALYSSKKSSNLLSGEFRSIYRGRSLDFDDLREYAYGDNVKDIDWKASSKTGKMLIRRYIAEKKHNILFVCDGGSRMLADTSVGASKMDTAITTLGTIAFLIDRHGDDFALIHSIDKGYDYTYFRSGNVHFENVMNRYAETIKKEPKYNIAQVLDYVTENIRRNMVVFVITDMAGVRGLDEKLLKKLTYNNDVMIINIDDAYLHGENVFDVEAGRYADSMFLHSNLLFRAEKRNRDRHNAEMEEIFKRYKVGMTTIKNEDEIIDNIVELFERHRYENIG
jgi:uncharacterized protein (DUF58 family)